MRACAKNAWQIAEKAKNKKKKKHSQTCKIHLQYVFKINQISVVK